MKGTCNPIDRHIGSRIRMRRQQLGISQSVLGDRLGVSFQQVQKYERGMNRVGGSRMMAIAQKLDVDVGFFYQNAPGSGKGRHTTEASLLDDFMASREGLVIARAFVRIADPRVRATIANSVAQLSKAIAGENGLQAAE